MPATERVQRVRAWVCCAGPWLLLPLLLGSCDRTRPAGRIPLASTSTPSNTAPIPRDHPSVDLRSGHAFLERWLQRIAAGADEPPLDGTWRGTLGARDIQVCFERRDRGTYSHGLFFDLRHRDPIGLGWLEEGGTWIDASPDSARWAFERIVGDTAVGVWTSHDGRTRPIRLTRLEQIERPPSDASLPCESEEFNRPLEKRPPVRIDTIHRQEGLCLRKRSVRWREQYREGIEVCPDAPRARRVNTILLARFPHSDSTWREFFSCTRSALSGTGRLGSEDFRAIPSFISRRFLSVTVTGDGYCGGAHPWFLTDHQTVDLESGREVDLWSWFADLDPDRPELPEALRTLLWSPRGCYSRNAQDDCSNDEEVTGFLLRLDTNGMVFSPSPGGCCASVIGNDRIVPYRKLLRFLNATGRRSVRAILGELEGRSAGDRGNSHPGMDREGTGSARQTPRRGIPSICGTGPRDVGCRPAIRRPSSIVTAMADHDRVTEWIQCPMSRRRIGDDGFSGCLPWSLK